MSILMLLSQLSPIIPSSDIQPHIAFQRSCEAYQSTVGKQYVLDEMSHRSCCCNGFERLDHA